MRAFLIAGLLFFSVGSFAQACSCAGFGGCPGLGVPGYPKFLSTVLDVTDLPRATEFRFLSDRKALLRVDEHFGGLALSRSCVEHDIDVFPSGSGEGRILDASDDPIEDASALVVPTEQAPIPGQGSLYWEFPKKNGSGSGSYTFLLGGITCW